MFNNHSIIYQKHSNALKNNILDSIGFTPLLKLNIQNRPLINLYAKLEYLNPTGSVKARAAHFMLHQLLSSGRITTNTTIIESSSGNFGLALSAFCKKLGLRFKCVVDPYLSDYNRMLMQYYGADIVEVDEVDKNGGYLLSRIAKVQSLVSEIKDSYWINQYGNPLNASAYYHTLGQEIIDAVDDLDYAFIGVSSGGTITGLSRKLKENNPNIKIIAVDIVGSAIFSTNIKKRYIPGIGSSMIPEILKKAKIDEVIHVEEADTVDHCINMLKKHFLFLGGSSGSVIAGLNQYFNTNPLKKEAKVLVLFPDGGEKYINTVYNNSWCKKCFGHTPRTI